MERLPYQEDLLPVLQEFCIRHHIVAGSLSVIGAVSQGAFACYDQVKRSYQTIQLNEELEIVSCQGNISILNEKPFVHAHILFSRIDGQVLGGHLVEGTILFAGELTLQEWIGPQRIRERDLKTGLNLWKGPF
ncbi:MAG: DUF296 domain-containing protein [Deltaproteobacteria bacterium]|nr:DUF296 domain-containing protein [Deltaproteobacteria bacterium]